MGNKHYQYQYAEVIDPLYSSLHNKALPVLRWEVRGDKVRRVDLLIQDTPRITKWFHCASGITHQKQVTLFKAREEFIQIFTERHAQIKHNRIMDFLNALRKKG